MQVCFIPTRFVDSPHRSPRDAFCVWYASYSRNKNTQQTYCYLKPIYVTIPSTQTIPYSDPSAKKIQLRCTCQRWELYEATVRGLTKEPTAVAQPGIGQQNLAFSSHTRARLARLQGAHATQQAAYLRSFTIAP